METITGFVDHIVFQNSENGYTGNDPVDRRGRDDL